MRREEMTRIRRELGLDLVEAGRKAGLAVSQLTGRAKPESDDRETEESPGLYFADFERFNAWRDA